MTGDVTDMAIDMVQVMGRADGLSLAFRRSVGLDTGQEMRSVGMAAEAQDRHEDGLQIEDIDMLLRRRGTDRWFAGYERGAAEVGEALDRRHSAELGEYVGAVCDLVSRELLAHIVTAAVQARDAKRVTRGEIVQAVITAVKRESKALDELGARARRGELFS